MSGFGGFCPLPLRLGGDAETGWSAAAHARMCADVAAAKRTLPLALISFTQVGSAATILQASCMWGGLTAAHRPTYVYGGGTGESVWTYDLNAVDPYEQYYPVTFRHGVGAAITDGTCMSAAVDLTQQHQITVALHDGDGLPCDGGATIVLW